MRYNAFTLSPVGPPPPGGAPAPRTSRDRSPILAVVLQVVHELPERHDRLAWRSVAAGEHPRRQPSLAHRIGEQRVRERWAAPRLRCGVHDRVGISPRRGPNSLPLDVGAARIALPSRPVT